MNRVDEEGQVMSAGTRRDNRPAGDGEHGRSTAQVKLRLGPADAMRLRVAANAAGVTQSEYVVALMDGARTGSTSFERDAVDEQTGLLATVSLLANALYAEAENLRLLRADLGRAGGLMKHQFAVAPAAAEQHAFALADAVRDVHAATARADAAIESLAAATNPLRRELASCAARLARLS